MKSYELLIQQRQPGCGGKPPYKTEIRNVATDDPVEYVRRLEPYSELEVTEPEKGVIMVSAMRNGLPVRYEFSED